MSRAGIPGRVSFIVRVSMFMLGLAACATREEVPQRYEYSRLIMGVKARLVVWAPSGEQARAAARAAFARMEAVDAALSDYRRESEAMRLCRRAGQGFVPVGEDLFQALATSRKVARCSGGAFDVTVGPLVALWREARKTGRPPEKEALERARRLCGMEKIVLDEAGSRVRLLVRCMRLDFGGIGKGQACDRASQVLDSLGLPSHLVELGGDLVAGDAPPSRRGWRISLGGATGIMDVKRVAVATSGDAEAHLDIGGVRYSHIIDPRTGIGLTNRIRVTLLAPTGAWADALASAVSVLGEEQGLALVESLPGMEARIESVLQGAGSRVVVTRGFPEVELE